VISVREDDGDDWLDLCLPLGALGRIETRVGAFPFGDDGGPESMTWRRAFDDWLAEVGRAVYRRVTFKIAVIGFEVSGTVTAESLAEGIPEDRGFAVLQPEDQLRYFPATR
jgi:hypothetical protein